MDYKTFQQKIKYYKEELLALKCPQGVTKSVDTYYYEMYGYSPNYLYGSYTIHYTNESSLPPITVLQFYDATGIFLGKYDSSNNTQKLFIDQDYIEQIFFMSTREIAIIEKDQ